MIRKEKKGKQVKITFVLPEHLAYQNPCVVGDFNNWDPAANPFKKRANKTLSTSVTVPTNTSFAFRYLAEDGQWFDEEQADGFVLNEFGTANCSCET